VTASDVIIYVKKNIFFVEYLRAYLCSFHNVKTATLNRLTCHLCVCVCVCVCVCESTILTSKPVDRVTYNIVPHPKLMIYNFLHTAFPTWRRREHI
jgi:hypothetical protein